MKVSVPATELIKIPAQRDKLMKVLTPTPPKKVTFQENQGITSPINKDDSIDLLVILQN